MEKELQDRELASLVARNFEVNQLPRALDLRTQFSDGEPLSESDRQFLDQMLGDLNRASSLVEPDLGLGSLRTCAERLCTEMGIDEPTNTGC
jgi:hypothetical protein